MIYDPIYWSVSAILYSNILRALDKQRGRSVGSGPSSVVWSVLRFMLKHKLHGDEHTTFHLTKHVYDVECV